MKMRRIIFVTGTDTGVGKTLLAGMLLFHARQQGIHALAMKPFCSGGTEDVDFLQRIQGGELTSTEINPFHFSQPLAPYAAQKKGRHIPARDALRKIKAVSKKCEVLFVEGSGGLLVPLGERYFVIDLIASLGCDVVLVSRNKLGTINHTLLSIEALRSRGMDKKLKVALVGQRNPDRSAVTNGKILSKLGCGVAIFSVPFLGEKANGLEDLEKNCRKIKKTLAQLMGRTYFPRRSLEKDKNRGNRI